MVQLDRRGGSVGRAAALDHVRIERAWPESGAVDLGRFVGKAFDKGVADAAPLFLRSTTPQSAARNFASAFTTCKSVLK